MPLPDRSPPLTPSSSQWAPPRAPLSPHRLAKLANALGISAPIPHSHTLSPLPPPPSASPLFTDHVRRSPTPSTATTQTYVSPISYSKYLLHVLPPEHLPHELEEADLAPPTSASGYHVHFRRGVMVPVYPTLQSQLAAIAREYALPSTLGMVLYLVTSSDTPAVQGEPGPRISDDIWKHIWTRVLRAEKDEIASSGPRPLGLGFGIAGRSSPALLQDIPAIGQPQRHVLPSTRPSTSQSVSPSPSTPSNSAYSSQSEIELPESASSVSASGDAVAISISLPGLSSPALIPILAKIEFDIDRRRAVWYDAWVRNRRSQNAKRAESRADLRSRSRLGSSPEIEGDAGSEPVSRKAPLDLELLGKINADGTPKPSFLLTYDQVSTDADGVDSDQGEGEPGFEAGYQQLSDEEDSDSASGADLRADPLVDVFGTDAETWAEIHSEAQAHRISSQVDNPNIVDLALDGAALGSPPEEFEDKSNGDDEGEVTQLFNALNRPSLSLDIPASSLTAGPTETNKKRVPPPLNLDVEEGLGLPQVSPGLDTGNRSAYLPYLGAVTPSEPGDVMSKDPHHIDIDVEVDELFRSSRSPQDEKREGAIFDELNLGLDASLLGEGDDYDENDPHDRRRSQYIMSAQLDEIEKALAQLSPRKLNVEIRDDTPMHSGSSLSFSPSRGAAPYAGVSPSSPRRQSNLGPAEGAAVWPAVPYSILTASQGGVADENRPPSPPRFAFNGVSTEPPKSFQPKRSGSNLMSDESVARKRALEEDNGLYPPLTPGVAYNRPASDSPVIPLSPDPFGRFPSQAEVDYTEEQRLSAFSDESSPRSVVQPPSRGSSLTLSIENERPVSQTPSSRFSLDSVTSDDITQRAQKTPSTLISVKTIRKLWRKSGNKGSISNSPQPDSGRSSPNLLTPPPSQAQQPQTPQVVRKRSKSISRPPPDPAPPSPLTLPSAVSTAALQVPHTRDPSYKQLHFNQDSPYPIHPIGRSPPAPPPRELSSPPVPPLPSNIGQSSSLDRSSGARKSILKSWKSASGMSTHGPRGSISRPSSGETPRSSTEQLAESSRKRRPSVLDIATSVIRNSMAGSAAGANDIPPSPALPEQFVQQMSQSRPANRQSNERHDSGKHRPSMSLSNSSPPRTRSPLTAVSPSQSGTASRQSVESSEGRPSLDISQFEIVSPKKDSFGLGPTLSYPYHGLDHSVASHE